MIWVVPSFYLEEGLSKTCAKCKETKDVCLFHRNAATKDGFYSYCKACKAAADKEYYETNREDILEKVKERAATIRPKLAEYHKVYRAENADRLMNYTHQKYRNNPEINLYTRCKGRAKRLGVDFNLEVSDIVIPEQCPILCIPFVIGDKIATPNSPSLDRIDPTKGYVKGNVQVISYKANTMKSNANETDLILFADWVYRTYLALT